MKQIFVSPAFDLWVGDDGVICFRAVPGTHELTREAALILGEAFLEAVRVSPDGERGEQE